MTECNSLTVHTQIALDECVCHGKTSARIRYADKAAKLMVSVCRLRTGDEHDPPRVWIVLRDGLVLHDVRDDRQTGRHDVRVSSHARSIAYFCMTFSSRQRRRDLRIRRAVAAAGLSCTRGFARKFAPRRRARDGWSPQRWSFRAQRAKSRGRCSSTFRRDASDDNHVAVVVCRNRRDAIVEQRILLRLGPPIRVLSLRRNARQGVAIVLARRRRIDCSNTDR